MWDGCGDWQVITTNRWLRSLGGGSNQVGVHGTVLLPEQVGVWDREKGRPRNGHDGQGVKGLRRRRAWSGDGSCHTADHECAY